MKRIVTSNLLTISLIALFSSVVFGQCPNVSVTGPSDDVSAGDEMIFSGNVESGETKSAAAVSYNWTISNGTIGGGQGTSVIKIDTKDLAGQSITATLEIGGLPANCPRSASSTANVKQPIIATKIDEFFAGNNEIELLKLDNFALYLQNDPTAEGYLISYRGPKGKVGDAAAANKRMLKYLVVNRGVNPDRIKIVDGGVKQTPVSELWIVPEGAKPPKATPMTATPKAPTPKKPGVTKKT